MQIQEDCEVTCCVLVFVSPATLVRTHYIFVQITILFKSRAYQISHTLPTTRHRCNLDVWALARSRGDGHRSLVTPERVLSEYNEDLIFLFFWLYKKKLLKSQNVG